MRTKRPARKRGSLNPFRSQLGVASTTSFKLRKVVDSTEQRLSSLASVIDGKAASVFDGSMLKSLLIRRPWIIHHQNACHQLQEDSNSEQFDKELFPKTCLPKGVVRGCPDCRDCLKVTARWQPEKGKKQLLQEAPVFHPTEEEFKDTLKYIANVRPSAEPYGICRIVPPPSWHPPCMIIEKSVWEDSLFESLVQRIDGSLDQSSGYISNCSVMEGFEQEPGPQFSLKTFKRYSDDFVSQYFTIDEVLNPKSGSNMHVKQREPSLEDIEGEYRRIIENPTEEMEVICGDNLDSHVFGSGFPSRNQFSENDSDQDYVNSGWNLKNTAVLPDSLLSFENPSTSRLLQPRLRVGMCFSSLPWKIAEHHLYSLSYMHLGSPKIWYAVPGSHRSVFDATMKKCQSGLGRKYSKTQHYRRVSYIQISRMEVVLIHALLVQLLKLTPTMLKSEGMPVYRCVQYPGEFVLVLPRSHYSNFDSGFNCCESINLAPLEWLPNGQNVVDFYSEQARKTSLSQDKLLIGAAKEAVRAQWLNLLSRKNTQLNTTWRDAAGKDGILAKALDLRIKLEASRRKHLCNSSQSRKMDKDFDTTSKKECELCYYDLHLSAASCSCNADRYSCLIHAKQLCSCPWSRRSFLYRYGIDELRVLLEAVGGNLTAIYKWARDDLKLSLHSIISDNSSHTPKGLDGTGECKKERIERLCDMSEGRRSTVSDIKEELKARMLQRKLMDEKKLMKGNASVPVTVTCHSSSVADKVYTVPVPEVSSDSSSESCS
ncbi:Lysine-specific demethylase JMJ703 [Linum grandiflorum]